jgi:uncharacterized protein YozE (UPF0346 family)
MIRHHFNKEVNILEVFYEGDINADDIIKFANYIYETNELPKHLKILTDARKAEYKFNTDAVTKMLDLLKQNINKYDSVKDAFIHANPKETAYSMLFEFDRLYDSYSHKVFAGREAALHWLMQR